MTLREAYVVATVRLAAEPHLRDQASLDAATLLLHALRLPRTALHAHPGRLLTAEEIDVVDSLVTRRLGMEPIQYILGEQEFYGLSLRVTPATLIPRPETELLVEAVLGRVPQDRAIDVVDVGTGSGAIAIALTLHVPQARLLAVDVSPEALAIARGNAERHGLSERISFTVSDLLASVFAEARFDAIVSNPPYVPERDGASLHPQVRDHEPPEALFAGADGLGIYRRLIPEAWMTLKPGGLLALEFGFGQVKDLTRLLEGWKDVDILDDLQGIPRVALARR